LWDSKLSFFPDPSLFFHGGNFCYLVVYNTLLDHEYWCVPNLLLLLPFSVGLLSLFNPHFHDSLRSFSLFVLGRTVIPRGHTSVSRRLVCFERSALHFFFSHGFPRPTHAPADDFIVVSDFFPALFLSKSLPPASLNLFNFYSGCRFIHALRAYVTQQVP